ncbi:unnamed protein product [Peniophora sp. CBMAI 1063]|nr:unnamed protein product [Peniophora sp. CBMAI 1063]
MSSNPANATQVAQIFQQLLTLNAISQSAASTMAPLLLVESLLLGVLSACAPIGSYLLWFQSHPLRAPFISVLWIVTVTVVVHWALSIRQLMLTIRGRTAGIDLSLSLLDSATRFINQNEPNSLMALLKLIDRYLGFGSVWRFFLALITESVLFGFSSSLFAIMVYTGLKKFQSQRHALKPRIIIILASVTYILSLTHWATSYKCFTLLANAIAFSSGQSVTNTSNAIYTTLLALFSTSVIMSDAIVLWRMCVVWDKARFARGFAVILLITTLALNIGNIVIVRRDTPFVLGGVYEKSGSSGNSEVVLTYGGNNIGLAAAFVSLGSNLCATILVAVKAWLHRRLFTKHLKASVGRTFVQRILELLVESGAVYSVIWLLYCVSIIRPISAHRTILNLLNSPDIVDGSIVTAADYLNAAMAQIISIYPLAIFILVSLDKIHHSRGPQTLRGVVLPQMHDHEVNVTFNTDTERDGPQRLEPSHQTAALRCLDDDVRTVGKSKGDPAV